MRIPTDHNGQPIVRAYNYRAVRDRQINEMLGLLKGFVCDGVLSDDEIYAFRRWLRANPDAEATWPGKTLAQRLYEILEDGRVDEHERQDLYELFCATCGQGDDPGDTNQASALPFNDPIPTILFDNQLFVFTGAFVYGTRQECERAVVEHGGKVHPRITQGPLTLVVGFDGSRDWKQSSFGRKIELAVSYREAGYPVAIIGEEHWTQALEA